MEAASAVKYRSTISSPTPPKQFQRALEKMQCFKAKSDAEAGHTMQIRVCGSGDGVKTLKEQIQTFWKCVLLDWSFFKAVLVIRGSCLVLC